MKINDKFNSLVPPLSDDEQKQLEENILSDGIRDPLVLWGDVLVDGHNRYEIAKKHGLSYKTVQREFKSEEEAVTWIILNQFGRRNLSAYDRSVLALKLKPLIAKKAKEKQMEAGGAVPQKSAKAPVDTRAELATIAGVSHDTIAKVEKIEEKAPEPVKEQLRAGEISINHAYKEVRKQEILDSGDVDALQSLYDESVEKQKENVAETREIAKKKAIVERDCDVSNSVNPEKEQKVEPKNEEPQKTVDFQKKRDEYYEARQRQIDEDYAVLKKLDAVFNAVRTIRPREYAQAVKRRAENEKSTLEFRIKEAEDAISVFQELLVEMKKKVRN